MSRYLKIESVLIKGLNHKCDVVFNLEENCCILIGENGIGKTSALKILQYLLKGMITSVARYVFDEIIIIDNETEYVFSLSDFLVSDEHLIEEFNNKCLPLFDVENHQYITQNFNEIISKLKAQNLLGTFLDELFYESTFSYSVKNIIEQYFDCQILFNMDLEVSYPFPCYKQSLIYDSDFYDNFKDNEYWLDDVVFGDMIEKVTFSSVNDSIVSVNIIDGNNIFLATDAVSDNKLEELVNNLLGGKVTVGIYCYNEKSQRKEKLFEHYELCDLFLPNILLHIQRITKKTDIHSMIKALYFSTSRISQINMMVAKGTKDYLNQKQSKKAINEEEVSNLVKMVDKKVIYTHENYIRPYVAEGLPFSFNISRLKNKISWYLHNMNNNLVEIMDDIYLLSSYMSCFDDLSALVLTSESDNSAVCAFKDLVNQYINDKIVSITPAGVKVYLQKDNEIEDVVIKRREIVDEKITSEEKLIFGKTESEIGLDKLSSGESKILFLLFYACFSSEAILIMDEPELSISILWQEKLIVDLLDYGHFRNIAIATHSPYIARNASLSSYIEYLP